MNTVEKAQEKEVWRNPASLHTPWIEVSNMGRVRTLPHKVQVVRLGKKSEMQISGKIRALSRDTRGRAQCHIKVGRGKVKGFLVHRLVAECFVPNPKRYKDVGFKNTISYDCRADNLIWLGSREHCRIKALSSALYKIVVKDGKTIKGIFNGCTEAGRHIGVRKQAVWMALKRGRKIKGRFTVEKRVYKKYEKQRERNSLWG